ncbi:MAG: glycosyltransferase family 2 protein [Ferruginibacter sp.]
MEHISVIIITFNEERNIGATLDAAWKVADEIIVADSGSTDHTQRICIEKGVRFINQPWLGYGEQRNSAVAKAAHNYILVLDADEVLDDTLIQSILQLKQHGFSEKVYALRRSNYYFGKFIQHGLEGLEIKPRLYERQSAKWNNKLVHEELEFATDVKVIKLNGHLLHYTYRTMAEYMIKADKYTTLSAEQYYQQGKSSPGIIKLVVSPAFTFVNAFIIKAGFLDGWHGFILAKLQAYYVLCKYAKLKMIYYKKRNEQQ